MTTLSRLRLIGAAVLVSSAAALSAAAQTQTPAPETQPTPPAAKPAPTTPPTGMKPAEPSKSPAMPSGNQQSAAPGKNPMIGLTIFSSDGSKLGTVQSLDAGPDGTVKAIRFKTGGFLGFGGKLVEVPEGKFTKSGDNVRLGMTAEEVSKLPEVKNQS